MDISRVVDAIAADLRRVASVGGEGTERAAELLVGALEPTVRLHLLEALGDAAAELEASAPGSSVSIRVVDREPQLRLGVAAAPAAPVGGGDPDLGGYVEGDVVRLTLRLPEGLKARVDAAAAGAGASVNSWLVTALARSVEGLADAASRSQQPGRRPKRMTGFVQG